MSWLKEMLIPIADPDNDPYFLDEEAGGSYEEMLAAAFASMGEEIESCDEAFRLSLSGEIKGFQKCGEAYGFVLNIYIYIHNYNIYIYIYLIIYIHIHMFMKLCLYWSIYIYTPSGRKIAACRD